MCNVVTSSQGKLSASDEKSFHPGGVRGVRVKKKKDIFEHDCIVTLCYLVCFFPSVMYQHAYSGHSRLISL